VIRYFLALWRNLYDREKLNEDLDEELRAYLDSVVADKMSHGATRDDAIRQARRELGGLEQVKQAVRENRTGVLVETLILDFRYTLRTLARNIGFSTVIILTLALGIGANSAMFALVNGVLIKPLPYGEPDRLMMLWETSQSDRILGTVAPANYYDWHEQSHSFAKMAAIDPNPDFILTGSGQPRRLAGAAVSQEFFSLLGVRMTVGRDFLPAEDRPGANQVVILSYSTWTNFFGGRPDVAGRSIRLNDTQYTIVGVLPRDFYLVGKSADYQSRTRFDVWTPLALPSPPPAWQRGTHPLRVFARLKPGISIEKAHADLNQVAANLQRLYPDDDKQKGIAAVSLGQHVVGGVRLALFTLLGSVAMVLFLACANIANLLLTRGATRQKEIAVRIALGASRPRVARQLLTESLVLALAGGVLGFILALVGIPALVAHLPADLPRAAEIAVDWRVMSFTSLISILTGVLFGMVPLYQSRLVSANDSLKSGRAVATGQSLLRSSLIVGQVAIAAILMSGAGLLTKSFWKLTRVSPGFQTEHILTARLSLPPRYTNGNVFGTGKHLEISHFQAELLRRVKEIPKVQSAAFTSYLPMSGVDNSWAFDIEGRAPNPPGVYDVANYRPVSAAYFETMGIPILRGREFSASDNENSPLVVLVNATMARTWWGTRDPIGMRLRFGDQLWRTIVGVVDDVHHGSLETKPEPELYVPYGQVPNVEARPVIVLRASVDPAGLISQMRLAVAAVDPNVPMDQVETMKQFVYGSEDESRFRMVAVLSFALLAMFVASIGLYGVMSYSVAQRTREFGIRMAVGATRGAVFAVVLANAAELVAIGICLGVVGALLLARLIATLLYGVTPFDASTFVGVSLLMAAVALFSSYLPAQRAARINPMDALRYE
jgi:predicted permease